MKFFMLFLCLFLFSCNEHNIFEEINSATVMITNINPSLKEQELEKKQGFEQESGGVGSGFFISEDGYLITNAHVLVAGNKEIKKKEDLTGNFWVIFIDKSFTSAKVIAFDPQADLALLKVDNIKTNYLKLGDSEKIKIGDKTYAFGNPMGNFNSLSSGIISNTKREMNPLYPIIQSDTPINKGNSGGALFDKNGKVIGINVAIISPSGGSIGISYSIPVNYLKNMLPVYMKGLTPSSSLLGLKVTQAYSNEPIRKPIGIVVNDIMPNGPSEHSGLEKNDIINGINNKEILNLNEFLWTVSGLHPDQPIYVNILRNEQKGQILVTPWKRQ